MPVCAGSRRKARKRRAIGLPSWSRRTRISNFWKLSRPRSLPGLRCARGGVLRSAAQVWHARCPCRTQGRPWTQSHTVFQLPTAVVRRGPALAGQRQLFSTRPPAPGAAKGSVWQPRPPRLLRASGQGRDRVQQAQADQGRRQRRGSGARGGQGGCCCCDLGCGRCAGGARPRSLGGTGPALFFLCGNGDVAQGSCDWFCSSYIAIYTYIYA